MPALGLGVFQSPPEETTAAVETALRERLSAGSTPPPPTATSARSATPWARFRAGPLRDLPGDEGLDLRLRLRRDAARVRQERGQARRRADRSADPSPGAAQRPSSAPSTPIARWSRCCPTARSARSGSATSWSTTSPGCSIRRPVVPAVNQIEVHPVLRPGRGPELRRRARDPHAGVVADRRHHVLPRRRAHQHPRGSGDRRGRSGARQEPRLR